MKQHYRWNLALFCLCVTLSFTASIFAEPRPQAPAPLANHEKAIPAVNSAQTTKVADLAFLAGHWQGAVGPNTINQFCAMGDPTIMLCMFWLTDEKGTQMIEVYTFRDTPGGVEERIRFFSPSLTEDDSGKGVTMKLASYLPNQVVFENPTGTYPKRSTLTRIGDSQLTSHIELIDAQGKASVIDAQWKRVQ